MNKVLQAFVVFFFSCAFLPPFGFAQIPDKGITIALQPGGQWPMQAGAFAVNNAIEGWCRIGRVAPEAVQAQAARNGVELLAFDHPNRYLIKAALQQSAYDFLLALDGRLVELPGPADKLRGGMDLQANIPAHALRPGGEVAVIVELSSIGGASAFKIIRDWGLKNATLRPNTNQVEGILPQNKLIALAALPQVRFVLPADPEIVPYNLPGVLAHRDNVLNNALVGKNLQGQGMVAGVGDGGYVRSHFDLPRMINVNPETITGFGDHGDHVSGTVGGAGVINPDFKGMAPKCSIVTQQTSNIVFNGPAYLTQYGMVVTNNSYGFGIVCPTTGTYGNYTSTSAAIDAQAATTPALMHLFAASNDGATTPCGSHTTGFGTISSGYGYSKNAIVVGAVSSTDVIASFSSRGPVKDGRVKPDVMGVGTSVNSTIPTNAYGSKQGTSMATPGVTGSLTLLYQRFKANNAGVNPDGALMKALTMNTADDIGNAEVDFRHGYGRINMLRAVDDLDSGRYLSGFTANGASNNHTINVPAGCTQMKVMVYWRDKEAVSMPAVKALVNDLDAKLTLPNASIVLPWVLNPDPLLTNDLATRKVDTLNNAEQITVTNPTAGAYTLNVAGTKVPLGTQKYWVVYTFYKPALRLTYPIGGEVLNTTFTHRIRWEAVTPASGTWVISYSGNNGASWSTLSGTIAGTARMVDWTPGAAHAPTKQALIRISHSTGLVSESVSLQTFTFMQVPTISTTACDRHLYLSWPATTGATSYDLLRYNGSETLTLIANTTSTAYTLSALDNTQDYWIGIRANGAGGLQSPRSTLSKLVTTTAAPCPIATDIGVHSLVTPIAGRLNTSTAYTATQALQFTVKNYGNTKRDISAATLFVQVNGGAVQSLALTDSLQPNTASATLSPAATFNLSAAGAYIVKAWTNLPGDANLANDTARYTLRQLAHPATALPALAPIASVTSTQVDRAVVGIPGADALDYEQSNISSRGRLNAFAHPTTPALKTLTFDRSPSGTASTNYLLYNVNLANYATNTLFLDFDFVNHGDLTNTGDKIWARGSDAQPWVQVYDFFAASPTAGTWTYVRNLNIKTLLGAQAITSSFQLRYGQEDIDEAKILTGSKGRTLANLRLSAQNVNLATTGIQVGSAGTCISAGNRSVTLTVRNLSTVALVNVPVGFRQKGGAIITGTLPSIAASASVSYTFPSNYTFGSATQYNLQAWVKWAGPSPDPDGNISDDTLTGSFAGFITTTTLPVSTGFETDATWVRLGTSSFEYGKPAGAPIDTTANGTKAWEVKLAGDYADDDSTQIVSPCYNFSTYTVSDSITLSLNTIFDTESDYDFAHIDYKIGTGGWTRLGAQNQGANWYNSIANKWHGEQHAWRVSSLVLPTPLLANNVRFRVVFTSDGSVTGDGFGMDDFTILSGRSIYKTAGDIGPITATSTGSGNWLTFNQGNRIVAQVQDIVNMGTVSLQARLTTGAARTHNGKPYLNRNFVITPSLVPGPSIEVPVRLYFTQAEFMAYQPSDAQATAFHKLGVAKYSGSNENLIIADNPLGFNLNTFIQPSLKMPYMDGYRMDFNVSDFSEFRISGSPLATDDNILPAVFRTLTARRMGTAVAVQWQVVQQQNVSHYIVERLVGDKFVAAGEVPAGQKLNYRFDDKAPHWQSNRAYYRIRSVDFDGAEGISSLAMADYVGVATKIRPYPVPASRFVFLGVPQSTITVKAINAQGQTLTLPVTEAETGRLDVSHLPPGLYHLQLSEGAVSFIKE